MAGLVYAHDLSIADRVVLKNLEHDITRHTDESNDDTDSASDTPCSSTSSLAASESSASLKRREAGVVKPECIGSVGKKDLLFLMTYDI